MIKESLALAGLFAFSLSVNAATMSFNNGSGTYSAGGVTGTVSATGGSLFYNAVENAVGVGTNGFNGAMAQGETLAVAFDSTITVNTIYFRQWENPGLFFTYDQVILDGGSFQTTLTDSGQGIVLLDQFPIGQSLDGFMLTPQNGLTAVYLHSIDFDVAEVPIPAAAWLFGSALVGFFGVSRKRKAS